MLDRTAPLLLILTMLIPACKTEEADAEKKPAEAASDAPKKCQKDADCKDGTLCESEACVPKEVAEKVRAAARSAASVAPAEPAAPVEEAGPIPPIPTEKSAPPKSAEWESGQAVNTQEPNSQPDKCTMLVVREWLQVSCREDYSSYERMENFGLKNVDYFEFIQPGKVVSFVVRLQKGKSQGVRICGEQKRATLFVNWPAAKERPVHVALGKGPACEGE